MAGEVHGEQEESQLLDHGDAALVREREGQQLHLRSLLGCGCRRCLRVQRRARPLGRPPQADQVFKVLQEEQYKKPFREGGRRMVEQAGKIIDKDSNNQGQERGTERERKGV